MILKPKTIAKSEFNKQKKRLTVSGDWDKCDTGLLEMACYYYGLFCEITEELEKEGLVEYLKTTNSQNNYLYKAQTQAYENYKKTISQFGVSLKERKTLEYKAHKVEKEAVTDEEENPFDEFVK